MHSARLAPLYQII